MKQNLHLRLIKYEYPKRYIMLESHRLKANLISIKYKRRCYILNTVKDTLAF